MTTGNKAVQKSDFSILKTEIHPQTNSLTVFSDKAIKTDILISVKWRVYKTPEWKSYRDKLILLNCSEHLISKREKQNQKHFANVNVFSVFQFLIREE